ncbi:MAG: Ion transport 2 protein [Alphaproteobacteria bacterium]|nr:Ion transport 2 protein [Alphaproteobacteria bacterium]
MTFLIGLGVAFITLLLHYEILLGLTKLLGKKKRHHRHDMLIITSTILLAHLLEAGVFAVLYWVRTELLHLDRFNITEQLDAMDYFYFSAETYTTVGYGDMYLLGKARLLNSIEGLAGLILIGWSSSFMFLYMKENWEKFLK